MTTATLPARLAAFEHRPLTRGELLIAKFMFEDEAPFTRTSIVQLPKLGFGAMTPISRAIIFSHWQAPCDCACADLDERGWFVHELTHVWQALQGTIMPLAKLGAMGSAAYRYKYEGGKPFAAYNIEQQAEIGRHVFLARSGRAAPDGPPPDLLERLWSEALQAQPRRRVRTEH